VTENVTKPRLSLVDLSIHRLVTADLLRTPRRRLSVQAALDLESAPFAHLRSSLQRLDCKMRESVGWDDDGNYKQFIRKLTKYDSAGDGINLIIMDRGFHKAITSLHNRGWRKVVDAVKHAPVVE
jgi:hypothetical protein